MSDFLLARVSQTLANEHTLETLVRQLLEMLELVTPNGIYLPDSY